MSPVEDRFVSSNRRRIGKTLEKVRTEHRVPREYDGVEDCWEDVNFVVWFNTLPGDVQTLVRECPPDRLYLVGRSNIPSKITEYVSEADGSLRMELVTTYSRVAPQEVNRIGRPLKGRS